MRCGERGRAVDEPGEGLAVENFGIFWPATGLFCQVAQDCGLFLNPEPNCACSTWNIIWAGVWAGFGRGLGGGDLAVSECSTWNKAERGWSFDSLAQGE